MVVSVEKEADRMLKDKSAWLERVERMLEEQQLAK
jgi:hypothetical protein